MDPQATYTAFLEALDKHKDLKLPAWVDKLPALKVKKGAAKVTKAIVGQLLRREVEKGKDVGGIAAIRAVAEPASLEKLGEALAKSWYARGGPSKEKWQLIGAGYLGGELAGWEALRRIYKDADDSDGHHRCNAAIEMLGALYAQNEARSEPRAIAVTALDVLSTLPTKYRARRGAADDALKTLGDDRALLVAQNTPGSPEKKSEPIVRALLERRFERWMIDGARLSGFDFEEHIAEHPFVGGLARLLVWAVFTDKAVVPFRLEGGEPVDARGARVDLDPDARVGVVHPLELDEAQRETWRAIAKERELAAPFPQMDRKVFALRGDEPTSLELTRYQRLNYGRLLGPLIEAGFYEEMEGDMGGTESFAARYVRGNQYVSLWIGYGSLERVVAGTLNYAGQPQKDCKPWGTVDPVVVSEVLYALDRAGDRQKSRGTKAAGVAPKEPGGRKQTGKFPYAERAKSGRSKCVVCGEKIEKDTVRVAVERELDMGSFTRPGAAYLHDKCTAGAPELQRDDLDEVLTKNSPGVWPPS